jgi:Calx-beta domain
VSLSAPSTEAITVDYTTRDGTATADSDYQAAGGTLTFAPGETSKTVTVLVNGDREGEFDEYFFVYLTGATNAIVAGSGGAGTIADDEPRITTNYRTSHSEGNTGQTPFAFGVNLSSAYDVPVTVNWTTADGSATAGSDYRAASGTLTIPAGQTTGTITVLVNGDRLSEPTENFYVNLSGATHATIIYGFSEGMIQDDEPRISISDVTRYEGKKGKTTQFSFTVTLSAAYDQAVTMSFKTTDGTAKTSDSDYVARTGTLTFAPGETTKTITIDVKGDSKREANETFSLDLFGNSSNSLFTKSRGIGTIQNDD